MPGHGIAVFEDVPTSGLPINVPNGVCGLNGLAQVAAPQLALAVLDADVGVAGGVASLDGGGQVPASQLGNSPGFSVTSAQDIASGSFATGAVFPAFSASILSLPFVQGATGDVIVFVNGRSLATPGSGFHDGATLGVSIDAGPVVTIGGTTNQGLGDGRGAYIGGSTHFAGVTAGAHTFDVHLSVGFGLLGPATVLATTPAPLRIIALHK